jgi:hypothetical protein
MELPALAEVLFIISAIIFLFTVILILRSGILWEKHEEQMKENDMNGRNRKSSQTQFKGANQNSSDIET